MALARVLAAAAQPTCAWCRAGRRRARRARYTADNLFEYMDGNAEGYILYNFREDARRHLQEGRT